MQKAWTWKSGLQSQWGNVSSWEGDHNTLGQMCIMTMRWHCVLALNGQRLHDCWFQSLRLSSVIHSPAIPWSATLDSSLSIHLSMLMSSKSCYLTIWIPFFFSQWWKVCVMDSGPHLREYPDTLDESLGNPKGQKSLSSFVLSMIKRLRLVVSPKALEKNYCQGCTACLYTLFPNLTRRIFV